MNKFFLFATIFSILFQRHVFNTPPKASYIANINCPKNYFYLSEKSIVFGLIVYNSQILYLFQDGAKYTIVDDTNSYANEIASGYVAFSNIKINTNYSYNMVLNKNDLLHESGTLTIKVESFLNTQYVDYFTLATVKMSYDIKYELTCFTILKRK